MVSKQALPRRVVVCCTATLHGHGTVRLPDRLDAEGVIAAFSVETPIGAEQILRELDEPGRELFIDVERKQGVDILGIATQCIQHSTLHPHKPNDATVRSLDVLVTHLMGADLGALKVGVVGSGNIGFKAGLLLVERGARVFLYARRADAAQLAVDAINAILPRHSSTQIEVWTDQKVDLMITAISARGAIGTEWLDRLSDKAIVVDVGIGNLSTEFLAAIVERSAHVVRLDTSATGSQLNTGSPDFFEQRFGRALLAGVPVVSGGIIGSRGMVVVDSFARPTRVLGLADGVGGLVPLAQLTDEEKESVGVVQAHLPGDQTGH
ncbi:hypothetical protein RKE38_13595 [Phycicoccus sp. M110.8]|uniref:hypothetical protein n=1 Tax=Phycicoccus sp. M110.8 TaxID=3075433 RepID=UPI0028FD1B3B|nr:hypothetical protein [Phycicoccus sp. M110.8]MDU0314727.1 hypothetical protein [Phycicoccus sp. M110.8]